MNFPRELRVVEGWPLWIIGGGPSLRNVEWSRLAGRNTIAINAAVGYVPSPLALITEDLSFLLGFGNLIRRGKPRRIILSCRGETYHRKAPDYPGLMHYCSHDAPERYPLFWGDPIPPVGNSGLTALILADLLRPSEIRLLGFDCRPDPPDVDALPLPERTRRVKSGEIRVNFHDDYPPEMRTGWNKFEGWIGEFNRWTPHIRTPVFNCTPGSALHCFPWKEAFA